MDKKDLAVALYNIGVVKFGSFTLKSGQQSNYYIDFRNLVSYPALIKLCSQHLHELVKEQNFDVICGVPYAALPLATSYSLDFNVPLVLQRKEAKAHGTKKRVEGIVVPGQQCLVVEDVVTTGGSVIDAARQLEMEGLVVRDLIVLMDRGEGAATLIESAGYKLHRLFDLQEFIHLLLAAGVKSQVLLQALA